MRVSREGYRNGTEKRVGRNYYMFILCVLCLRTYPRKKKEVPYMRKDALEYEHKMQEAAVILDGMGYKKSADTIDRFRFDLWNCKSFPRSHWRKIRTINDLERINKELKRRSRVSEAYSNDQSLQKVAVCIMMDINKDWVTGNK
jgi:transposase-like protein